MPTADTEREPLDRSFVLTFAALFAVAVGAVALIGYGLFGTDDREQAVPPPQVESYAPVDGAQVTSQITISVDLQDDHTGVLVVDGLEIPLDQIAIGADDIGILQYRPTEGSATGELQPGLHRVVVEFWPSTQSRAASQTFRWEFRVTA